MNIYVGNLNYKAEESLLKEKFSEYGTVDSVKIIQDRETGKSKGFGFIEMPDNQEASQAIETLNGADFMGRTMVVNQARPRE